jgi:hypothetical protein
MRRLVFRWWRAGGTWNGSCLCTGLGGDMMNLVIWLPAMFLLGLVTMIACYAFIGACEKI